MTKWLACAAILTGILAIGCSGGGEDTTTTTPTNTTPAKSVEKSGGKGEMGSAELKPGMSASEADARVGSMSGGK